MFTLDPVNWVVAGPGRAVHMYGSEGVVYTQEKNIKWPKTKSTKSFTSLLFNYGTNNLWCLFINLI